jgi:phage terminase large subunit
MECTIVFQKNWEAIHAVNPDGTRKYKYIVNEGSSRSSKTVSLIDCYDLYARAYYNKRMTVWRDTKTDCKKTVLNDTLKRLKSTGRYKTDQEFNKTESIFTYITDSTFEIHGTDDEETVHGLTQDCSWLNEPYKISRETFDQIDQRTSDFVFIDWNPKKNHWIDDIKKDPRCITIKSTFKDNPFCPPEQRKKILSYQPVKRCDIVEEKILTEQQARVYNIETNPLNFTEKALNELSRCIHNEYVNSANDFNWMVYGLGLKGERPNRIFHWTKITNEAYNAIKVPSSHHITCIDWGAVDPWGILDIKYYDGAIYLHQLNYKSENKLRDELLPTERAQIDESEEGFITWYFNRFGIPKDRVIVCDNNRPKKILGLRRIGYDYAVAAIKGAGSIVDGVDGLNSIKVYFTASSEDLEYEQENYSRKVDPYGVVLEEPEDLNNHLIDPSRYGYDYLVSIGVIKAF